jgi:hypothetical protein
MALEYYNFGIVASRDDSVYVIDSSRYSNYMSNNKFHGAILLKDKTAKTLVDIYFWKKNNGYTTDFESHLVMAIFKK